MVSSRLAHLEILRRPPALRASGSLRMTGPREAATDNARRRSVLFSRAMNAPTREVNESTVCPVDSSLWLR